jgi:hypothetical protein
MVNQESDKDSCPEERREIGKDLSSSGGGLPRPFFRPPLVQPKTTSWTNGDLGFLLLRNTDN